MAIVSYEDFCRGVELPHMEMLGTFATGNRIATLASDEAGVEALKNTAAALYANGLVWRVTQGYQMDSGVHMVTFDGFIDPIAAGYIMRLAVERLVITREPLPA